MTENEYKYKAYYYRGLAKYKIDTRYLEDTCLMMQDRYEVKVEKFLGGEKNVRE